MLALHTWTLDTTPLAEVLRVARRVGWDGIELRRVDFARAAEQGQSAADVLALVRTSGLPVACVGVELGWMYAEGAERRDRKSTRLNSSHGYISYAVFCLKKKKTRKQRSEVVDITDEDAATLHAGW